jgi:hypothetical protein
MWIIRYKLQPSSVSRGRAAVKPGYAELAPVPKNSFTRAKKPADSG